MSHINGDITTRELLFQAVHHLDSYNATRHGPTTSSHSTRQSNPRTTTVNICAASMSSNASLHYSLVPPLRNVQQENSSFSQR